MQRHSGCCEHDNRSFEVGHAHAYISLGGRRAPAAKHTGDVGLTLWYQ
jgi:hypothetical protein